MVQSLRSILAAVVVVMSCVAVHAQSGVVAGVTPTAWRSLGPTNIAGSITALSIDPRDPRVMLAVSPHGGIWRSVDAGASWFPLDALFAQLQPGWHANTGAIARDPRNPNSLIAGLGTTLARSGDGGATWTLLPSPGETVPWLAWGPDGSIWRSTSGQLWRSTDGGNTFQSVLQNHTFSSWISFDPSRPGTAITSGDGSVYLTNDSGATWTRKPLSLNPDACPAVVSHAPSNPGLVYALCGSTLYKSSDGGATYATVRTGPVTSPTQLWVDPVNAAHLAIVYEQSLDETADGGVTFRTSLLPAASFQLAAKPGFNGTSNATVYLTTRQGIFRTDNGSVFQQSTWQPLNDGLTTAQITGGDGVASTGIIVAGAEGTGTIRSSSVPGDRSWRVARADASGFGIPALNRIAIDHADPSYAYAADHDGHVFRSRDGGQTFPEGLAATGITGSAPILALQPDNQTVLVTGLVDLRRTLDARAASPMFTIIVPAVPTIPRIHVVSFRDFVFAPSQPSTAWASFDRLLLRFDDLQAAPTWTYVGYPGSVTDDGVRLAIDPVDPKTVYAASAVPEGDGLYRTRDAGATWTDLSGGSTATTAQEVPGQLPPWQAVYAVTMHPDKRTWLYAGTEAGVYASDDDGGTWTFVGPTRAPVSHLFWTQRTLVAATYGRGLYSVDLGTPGASLPAVTIDKTALSFGATSNGASLVAQTPAQTVRVTQSGSGTVTWTAVPNQPWLTVTPASGRGSGTFDVSVTSAGGVPPHGASSGSITLVVSGSANGVAPIAISLNVVSNGISSAPFGAFDVPVAGSLLQGSVALSGWALDDIGVERVELWRDLQPGETTPPFASTPDDPRSGKVYIANATFVDGARPDVESAFPFVPFRSRAGWGYLMLTWGLPDQGRGTHTFYAFAFDKETRVSLLGAKTVQVDNASATRPFGAIDTPGIGAVVNGTVVNFGWALTPKVNGAATCAIAASGVQVSIDSGPLQPVDYGDARPDVAGAFSGFSNDAAAGGHFILDTALLADGVHTIAWSVTDDCGRADGVGSRFFTVANPSLRAVPPAGVHPTASAVAAIAPVRVIQVAPNQRIHASLPGGEAYRAGRLPAGSTFDPSTNTFYWQPAPGFLGTYDLTFTSPSRVEKLRVVVGPPVRMAIDTPRAGNVLAASGFTVAGWAVDLASLEGAGIDTLHVWAYPLGGGAPEFVGVARPGGARPDVGGFYGPSFGNAGYTLTGRLAPGTYDLVVFAHIAATNSFAAAETVGVIVR